MRSGMEVARPRDRFFLAAAVGLLLAISIVVLITQVVVAVPAAPVVTQSSVAESDYALPEPSYTPRPQCAQPAVYYT
jgi:hypothetical protein